MGPYHRQMISSMAGAGAMACRLVVVTLAATTTLHGQDVPQRPYPPAARYFDFWEGTWYQVLNERPDTTGTRFIVRPGVHDASWEEDWRLGIDSTAVLAARAVRSWDATKNRWRYVWVSEEGHFQVWEGREVDGDWYIYREFEFPTDRYISRQAWIPIGPGRLRRVSEKSYDGGETWELRFSEEYVRERP